MKLVRYGEAGNEKPGLLDGDVLRDLSEHVDDIDGAALSESVIGSFAGHRSGEFARS